MAKIKKTVEELEKLLPEVPDYFMKWCESKMPVIPIYYRRTKYGAECTCGKCAMGFTTNETPERYKVGECKMCGHNGGYEWKKVTTGNWFDVYVYIVQKTKDNNLVIRLFNIYQFFKQFAKARIEIKEETRWFLTLGEVYRMDWKYVNGDKRAWCMTTYRGSKHGDVYPEYTQEISNSNFKYCDVSSIMDYMRYYNRKNGECVKDVLVAFANNPALEMYTKTGMKNIVQYVVLGEGKRKYVKRQGKTVQAQLGIKDKAMINRLIAAGGDVDLLKIFQYEQKKGVRWTKEQEEFAKRHFDDLKIFLKYMSIQQLMNRVEKYVKEKNSYGERSTVIRYRDYLLMREELEYDMTNEIYIHPKNLRKKHDELSKEKERNADELRMKKVNKQYKKITENYEKLLKKYGYEDGEYFIRPAQNAAEFILESKALNHCVGRSDWYMREHNKGASYIMFLRKKATPDIPYYTIEIRGTKILQWYSKGDKQPDKEVVKPLLDRWVEYLKQPKKKKTA